MTHEQPPGAREVLARAYMYPDTLCPRYDLADACIEALDKAGLCIVAKRVEPPATGSGQ